MNIVIIGAGRVATHLALALHGNRHKVVQIVSRTQASAARLAERIGCTATTDFKTLAKAEAYIISTSDSAINTIAHKLHHLTSNAVVLHTAGSLDMQELSAASQHIGVLYPFQTFSLEHSVDFSYIPLLLSWTTPQAQAIIQALADTLGGPQYRASNEQRRLLHLAAVFASNFANHSYALAAEILEQAQLPFSLLHPLIQETARKACQLSPALAQTGPAIRQEQAIIARHCEMLNDTRYMQDIYRHMSESIQYLDQTKQRLQNSTL